MSDYIYILERIARLEKHVGLPPYTSPVSPPAEPPTQPPVVVPGDRGGVTSAPPPAGRVGAGAAPAGVTQDLNDKRTIRDLSVVNGPGIIEGNAGHVDYMRMTRPAGELVTVTCSRTNSGFGAINRASIHMDAQDKHGEAGIAGSDCYAELRFTATGREDVIRVVLHEAGALAVQRN